MSETRKRNDWPDGPPRVDASIIDLSRPHLVGAMGELMTPLTHLASQAPRATTPRRLRDLARQL